MMMLADNIGFAQRLGSICSQLMSGVGASLLIFFLTLLFSLPLGLLVAFGRMSKFKPLSLLVKLYISVVRGTPLMLQLLVVFFGPFFLFGIRSTPEYRFYAVIIGFSLNYAAYFAEIYRGGIQSIPRGHYEAAEVLGYSKAQTFMKIVLPQVFKRILPAVGNEVITLVKDTSLCFVLALAEMFTIVKQIVAAQVSMVPFILAALVYWGFTMLVEFLLGRVEKHFDYYHD